jgi:amino acid transporter
MVILKLSIIVFVIVAGGFFVDTENWKPFMPNGFGGVVAGISAVFFAYIGFDAISTTAEECKNPKRDLPRGMLYSLGICTVLYILIALVLTGMTSFTTLKVMDPLAFVFEQRGFKHLGGIISASAVVALTGVLLVFQLGQPRIWLSMSRDGLLPKAFARVHPRFKTPSFSTIITGLVVGIPLFFFTTGFSVDFTSIGTLFAFLLVCAGTLKLPELQKEKGKYKMPGIRGTFIIPISFVALLGGLYFADFQWSDMFSAKGYTHLDQALLNVFIFAYLLVSVATWIYKWKFIPVAGVLMCAFLLTGMNAQSWKWFFGWFALGILIYFAFSYKNSRLADK